MAGRKATRVAAASTLFLAGLTMGLSHLSISVQLGVTLSERPSLVQTLVMFVYPIAFSCMGFGAVLQQRFFPRISPMLTMRLAGLSLGVFLIVTLRSSYLTASPALLFAVNGAALGAWFLLLGGTIAPLLGVAHGKGRVGWIWAAHLAGIVVGYLATNGVLVFVGANAVILAVGLSFLVLPRHGLAVLALCLAAAIPTQLDAHIERLRTLAGIQGPQEAVVSDADSRPWVATRALADEIHQPEWMGWSRYSQFRLVDGGSVGVRYGGLYNFKLQWVVPLNGEDPKRSGAPERRLLYDLVRPGGDVVIIGVGGGNGLRCLSDAHPGVIAVERDPAVVKLFRDRRPEWNDHLFTQVTTVAADGRTVVERADGTLDAIIIESARFQPIQSMRPAAAPLYLYTREALELYVRKLAPDGMLLMGFADVTNLSRNFVPDQVLMALNEAGIPHAALFSEVSGAVHVLVCQTPEALELRVQELEGSIFQRWDRSGTAREDGFRLTDAKPFATWASLGAQGRGILFRVALGIFLACGLAAAWLCVRSGRGGQGWNNTPYFFVIGVAYALMEIATFYRYRAFFGDEILTILRIIATFIAFAAIGSALSSRLPPWLLRPLPRVLGTAALLAVHYYGLLIIPFEQSNPWLRELFALLFLMPGGLLMGVFFPLGIAAGPRRLIGNAILADALGTLAGFSLLYLIYIPLGAWVFWGVAAGAYLGAVVLLRPVGVPAK